MHLCREGEREQGEYISSDTGARPSMCPTTVGHGRSSVSLSVVYSSTTAQPRSEWLALLISFYLSAINLCAPSLSLAFPLSQLKRLSWSLALS